MEGLVQCEGVSEGEACPCIAGGSLAVLSEVQKAYEDRMEVIERVGGSKKLHLQVEALKSWVGDLVGQNTLLAKTVQELEQEATARLAAERTRRAEKKRPCTMSRELSSKNDLLLKENMSKEREIRRLNKDAQMYEQTILNMRSEMPAHRNVDCPKKDAEVMVGMSCTQEECGAKLDGVGYGVLLKEESNKLQDRMRKMENNLKGSGEQVRALRKVNVALSEELHALRRVCAALDEQCRAAATRTAFKDDIIREMRRQLKQAKAKLKESESADTKSIEYGEKMRGSTGSRSCDAVARAQPRRLRTTQSQMSQLVQARNRERERDHNIPTLLPDTESPRLDGSGDDSLFKAG